MWTQEEQADAVRLGRRLVVLARRGRPAGDVALILFAEGLPVPPETVLRAARNRLRAFSDQFRALVGVPPGPEGLAPDTSALQARLDAFIASHPEAVAPVRRKLGKVPQDPDGADGESVLYALVGTVLGAPPDEGDTELLHLMLHFFGVHGLVERVGGTGPRVLENGVQDVGESLKAMGLPNLLAVLDDMTAEQAVEAERTWAELAAALQALPLRASHYLAAHLIAVPLRAPDPMAVTLRLAVYALLCQQLAPPRTYGPSSMRWRAPSCYPLLDPRR